MVKRKQESERAKTTWNFVILPFSLFRSLARFNRLTLPTEVTLALQRMRFNPL
jgi:hypothetical protein